MRVQRNPAKKADPWARIQPEYRFPSKSRAETEAKVKTELLGMDRFVYSTVGPNDEGKFAIVPVHVAHFFGGLKSEKTFKAGERVYDMTYPSREGVVKVAGPEVCEVQWDIGFDGTRNVPNYWLERAVDHRKQRMEGPIGVLPNGELNVKRTERVKRIRRIR